MLAGYMHFINITLSRLGSFFFPMEAEDSKAIIDTLVLKSK